MNLPFNSLFLSFFLSFFLSCAELLSSSDPTQSITSAKQKVNITLPNGNTEALVLYEGLSLESQV